MWEIWCQIAEEYLVRKASYESGELEVINNPRYYGRGRVKVERVRVGRAPDEQSGVCPQEDRREVQKLLNLLRETQHLLTLNRASDAQQVWSKACRVGVNCAKTMVWSQYTSQDETSIQAKIDRVEVILRKVTWGDRDRLIRLWRKNRLERASKGIGDLAKHFKGADQAQIAVLRKPNGEITGKIKDMDLLLRESWLPIFAKHDYTDQPYPDRDLFFEKYDAFIQEYPQELDEISLEKVKWAIGRLASEGAGGLDAWKPSDMKKLPDAILDLLVTLYQKIEDIGVWPQELCSAGITLIPKGEGGAPLDQRPITITSVVYRIWAAVRMRDSLEWQEAWMRKGQHGARAHHSTVDALMRVSLFFEEAIQNKSPAFGIAVDLSKAFDNVPIQITFEVCKKLGMHPKLLTALQGIYSQMQRRFRLGGYIGQVFKDTNGILQGCPLSVMLLNALMAVLSAVLEPTVGAESFVDDLTILHSDRDVLQAAMDSIGEFMKATGQVVNLKKTKTFGPAGGTDILYDEKEVPKTDSIKILGVIWKFKNGNLDLQLDPKKTKDAVALAHRIRYSGLPFHLRTMLNASLVMSKILYGIEILDIPPADERKLRTAVGYSIWQKSSKQRSPGLLFTLPCKGHVVDPTQGPHVRRVMALKRSVAGDEQVRRRLIAILQSTHKRRIRSGGFVENLLYTLKRIDARLLIEDGNISLEVNGLSLDLESTSLSSWAHQAREAARRMVWRSIDHERAREDRAIWGLAAGIDTDRSMQWYRAGDAKRQGILRKIILNAVWTKARRSRMPNNDPDPTCDCGVEKEDARHLWWRCGRWEHIRRKYECDALPYDEFSIAFRDLGLKLNSDPEVPVQRVQAMMTEIFTQRFMNLG